VFRNQGEPVLNLTSPPGTPRDLERRGLDVLREINDARCAALDDPEIRSRIASYELGFRMQAAAPDLIDLSRETAATLEAYGVAREDPPLSGPQRGGPQMRDGRPAGCGAAARPEAARPAGPDARRLGRGVRSELPQKAAGADFGVESTAFVP
jgi:hypothetical protein